MEASGFGTELYEERTAALLVGGAPRRGPRFDVGFRVLGLSAAGTEDTWSTSFDARLSAVVLGRLGVGGEWWNIGGSSIGGSRVSSSTRLGVALALERALLTASVLVESGFDPSPSLGLEFSPAPWLALRAGSGTRPGRFTTGAGLRMDRHGGSSPALALDLAWEWHPQLGVSSFASVSIVR